MLEIGRRSVMIWDGLDRAQIGAGFYSRILLWDVLLAGYVDITVDLGTMAS